MSHNNDDLLDFMAGEACGYRGSLAANLGADLYDQQQRERLRLQQPWLAPPREPRRSLEPRVSKSWFPGVDRWFDRHIPTKWRSRLSIVSAVFCALVAGSSGSGAGMSDSATLWLAGGGAVAGLLVFPALIFLVKLALLCLILTIAGGICWMLAKAILV